MTEKNNNLSESSQLKLNEFKSSSTDEKLEKIYIEIIANNKKNKVPTIVSTFLKTINNYYLGIIGAITVLYSIKGFEYTINSFSSRQVLTILLSVITTIISNAIIDLNEGIQTDNKINLPLKFALALFVTTWILFIVGLIIVDSSMLIGAFFALFSFWIVGLFVSFVL